MVILKKCLYFYIKISPYGQNTLAWQYWEYCFSNKDYTVGKFPTRPRDGNTPRYSL